jgi:Caspase domain
MTAIYAFSVPLMNSNILVFYYSGHGFYYPGHDTSDVCLASSEINPVRPPEYDVPYHEISGLLHARSCPAKSVVSILDCCHSGAANLSKGDANEAVKMVLTPK